MNKDITRYFTKHMSLSNIKVDNPPETEVHIMELVERAEADPDFIYKEGLSDYDRGILYFFGIGELRDEKEGLAYLKRAADQEDMDAVNLYAFANYHMSINSKDNPLSAQRYGYIALKNFIRAAEANQVEALFNLGVCYMEGRITDQDEARGRELLIKAEMLGHPRAAEYLRQVDIRKNPQDFITREGDKAEVFAGIVDTLKPELAGIPQDFSMVGLFNDVYLEKGYKWVKVSEQFGWMASCDEGKTYLITEAELPELRETLVSDNK